MKTIQIKSFSNKLFISSFFFLSLLAIYPPQSFFDLCPKNIKLIYRFTSIFVIFCLYLLKTLKTKKIDMFIIIMSLYSIFQIFSTIYNHAYIYAAIYQNTMLAIGGLLLLNMIFERGTKFASSILLIYFSSFVLLSLIISPFINKYTFEPWLIGRRTQFFLFIIPMLFSYYLFRVSYPNYKYIKIVTCLIYLLITITTFIDFCVTLFFTELFCIIFSEYFIHKSNKNEFNMNFLYLFILYIVILFLFVFFNDNFTLMKNIFILLGKTPTASGRTTLYKNTISFIKNRPLFINIIGDGILTPEGYQILTSRNSSIHNQFLQILLDFGIIGVLFLIYQIFFVYFVSLKQNSLIKNIVHIFLFVITLRGIYESYFYFDFLFILGIVYNATSNISFDFKARRILTTNTKY